MHHHHIPSMVITCSEFVEPLYLRTKWTITRVATTIKAYSIFSLKSLTLDHDTSIQKLGIADIKSLLSFIARHEYSCRYTYAEEEKDLEYLFNSEAIVLGLIRCDKLVGYGITSCNDQTFLTRLYKKYGMPFPEHAPNAAIVMNGVVAPDYRGRGYHKHLLSASEFYARNSNCDIIYAAVHDDNLPCLSNIRHFEYEKVSTLVQDRAWGLYAKKL